MPTRRECANAIRALAIDAIEKAHSGHPGAPLGMADMAEALWRGFLRHNPADPAWPDRDRFILSNGHASMLLYALLYLTGYKLPIEEIRNFRQLNSKTPGHPERGITPGVEMTTGPLGQGIASAVGIAMAESLLATRFNRPDFPIVNHYTWCFLGDGCMMEGVSHEACALAGTWKLGKLIAFYDSNGISIDGKIDPWFSENTGQRFAAYDWQVIGPLDGHDCNAIDAAIKEAQAETGKPSLIICKTHIGFGSPKEDSPASHGSPLGENAARTTREAIGWKEDAFVIPREMLEAWDARKKGASLEKAWNEMFAAYAETYPGLATEFKRRIAGELPASWPEISRRARSHAARQTADQATRVASRKCLEVFVPDMPELLGGSADLSGSVGTQTAASNPVDVTNYTGNYLFYGVREFGMGAIMNGIAIHGGFIPYAGTFLAFSDQAKNALRLAAIMQLHVIWILTHDSIGVGEDGPTHQPIEQIAALRLIPGLNVWRPCDDVETTAAWISAITSKTAPTALVLSRQKLTQYTHANPEDLARGGYILKDCQGEPEIIIMATGSEVQLAMSAADELNGSGMRARVVSLPCCEIFDRQPDDWKEKVLPPNVKCRIAIEAASADWWHRYVGLDGAVIGMTGYGSSAPGKELFKHFGFTVEHVVETAKDLVAKNR